MAKASEQEVLKTAERLAAMDSLPSKEDSQQEQEVEAPKEATESAEKLDKTPEATEEQPLPQDAKEAGRAFAEMRNRNKELETRLDELEKARNEIPEVVADNRYIAPLVENNFSLTQDQTRFFDQNTGEFDAIGYQNYVLSEARRETQRAIEEERQIQEANAAFPELNPKNSKEFDKDFYDAVTGLMAIGMRDGKNLTVKAAAEKVRGLSAKAQKQIASESAQRAVAEIAEKEAVSLEAGGNSGRSSSTGTEELEYLRNLSRRGDRDGASALAERLKNIT